MAGLAARRSAQARSRPITAPRQRVTRQVPGGRVADDVGAVEGGAELRRIRDLSAEPQPTQSLLT
jgi:hypothetical protein